MGGRAGARMPARDAPGERGGVAAHLTAERKGRRIRLKWRGPVATLPPRKDW
jgi:hypothetical protein